MRRSLDALYGITAALAGLALVAIAGLILAQMAGRWVGFQVRSADEFAGYALVATSFLAMGPTYRRGEHIRVGLLIDRLKGAARRVAEAAVLVFALACVTWGTWWAGRFVYDSFRFHELSQGLVPVPLWLPQAPMALGLAVFAIALLDDLFAHARGRPLSFQSNAAPQDGPGFER
jgi:TRAP-type C4-dicarboxylate transport system permease small subunit